LKNNPVDSIGTQSWLWSGANFLAAGSVPVSDRGFRYGMSVFETIRIANGTAGFLADHLNRLASAALKCGFPLPREALAAVPSLLSRLDGPGVARVYITAGDGAPAAPAETPRVVLLYEPRLRALPDNYTVLSSPNPHLPPFGGLKTANYWTNTEALRRARLLGAEECLLFRPDGRLTGAAMANVFVKTDEGWLTPSLQCGARDGVIRAWTLAQIPVRQAPLTRELVHAAVSVFLTSSWIGLMQVACLDGQPLQLDREIAELNPL
jgi:branched-subunit amino acid aminotransferase/4-amino-4-deoxychorismate lyase